MKLGDWFEMGDECAFGIVAMISIALVMIFAIGPCAAKTTEERTKEAAVQRAVTIEEVKKAVEAEKPH